MLRFNFSVFQFAARLRQTKNHAAFFSFVFAEIGRAPSFADNCNPVDVRTLSYVLAPRHLLDEAGFLGEPFS